MLRKMTLNKVKNYIKENNLFKGYTIELFDEVGLLFRIVDLEMDSILTFCLTSGFIASWKYLSWSLLPDITQLDTFLRDYESRRFNEWLERSCK